MRRISTPPPWRNARECIQTIKSLSIELRRVHSHTVAKATIVGQGLHWLRDHGIVADWKDAALKTGLSYAWVKFCERLWHARDTVARSERYHAKRWGIPIEALPVRDVFDRLTRYKNDRGNPRPDTTNIPRPPEPSHVRSEANALASYVSRNGSSSPRSISLIGRLLYPDFWEHVLSTLADMLFDVIFLDVPYYATAKDSTDKDRPRDMQFLLDYYKHLLTECKRLLKPGGSIFIFGIARNAFAACVAAELLDLRLISDIVWFRVASPPRPGLRLERRHEYVLWISNVGKPRWNSQRVRDNNYPDDPFRATKQDGRTKEVPLGDVWGFVDGLPVLIECPPVCHKPKALIGIPMKPPKLLDRIFDMIEIKGGLILDTCAGTGNILLKARERKMEFVACECNRERVEIIKSRVGVAEKLAAE